MTTIPLPEPVEMEAGQWFVARVGFDPPTASVEKVESKAEADRICREGGWHPIQATRAFTAHGLSPFSV